MRQRQGIAGATLIYGKQPEPPDLLLASQFLIDDLRRDGRTISGVRVSRHALRLRADGFELALSLTDTPLPISAFAGAVRPRHDTASRPDMTRGRVLHALRHHRWVLGVLMRLRGLQEEQSMAARLQALPGACHALTGAVAEAAPPMLVIWQANGLLCTAREFLRLPTDLLACPADRFAPVGPVSAGRAPLARPGARGAGTSEPANPRRAVAGMAEEATADCGTDATEADRPFDTPDGMPSPVVPGIVGNNAALPATGAHKAAPGSRAARAQRQSSGRIFGRHLHEGRVSLAASAGLARHDAQLAGALRHARPRAAAPGGPPLRRRAATALRIACICLALAPFSASDPDSMAARNALSSTMAPDRAPSAP